MNSNGGGPPQLIPAVRCNCPHLHRLPWRSSLLVAVLSVVGGFYRTRSPIADWLSKHGISAMRYSSCYVRPRRFALVESLIGHCRRTLRLFLVASAVWFFRAGLMGWILLTDGVGVDFKTFTVPLL